MMNTAAPPEAAASVPGRWSLYGDLPWRLLVGGVRACPSFLEPPLIAVWSFFIFLIAGKQRRAALENLRSLVPEKSGATRVWLAWRAFYHFAVASVDGIREQQGVAVLTWEVAGQEHFQAAEAADRPAILTTAHMGSYDAAAAFFAGRMGRPCCAVRMPERHPRLRALRESGLRQLQSAVWKPLYNTSETVLAVELLRALQRREWVAIQADRTLPGLTPLELNDGVRLWRLPKGPFVLAAAAGALLLPSFVRRRGHRRYRVTFFPPLLADRAKDGRDTAALALAHEWTRLLTGVLRESPGHWLVFEPAFTAPAS